MSEAPGLPPYRTDAATLQLIRDMVCALTKAEEKAWEEYRMSECDFKLSQMQLSLIQGRRVAAQELLERLDSNQPAEPDL